MVKYYVNENAQSDGYHEVHTQNCIHGPNKENRTFLGDFSSCAPAVQSVKYFV